ncbi:MAG: hypothetical protein JOZ17_00210 [Acetobacteraceae bacterium]|nr:hypothetical protein [Acetobacteraceae bacterium]
MVLTVAVTGSAVSVRSLNQTAANSPKQNGTRPHLELLAIAVQVGELAVAGSEQA